MQRHAVSYQKVSVHPILHSILASCAWESRNVPPFTRRQRIRLRHGQAGCGVHVVSTRASRHVQGKGLLHNAIQLQVMGAGRTYVLVPDAAMRAVMCCSCEKVARDRRSKRHIPRNSNTIRVACALDITIRPGRGKATVGRCHEEKEYPHYQRCRPSRRYRAEGSCTVSSESLRPIRENQPTMSETGRSDPNFHCCPQVSIFVPTNRRSPRKQSVCRVQTVRTL